LHLDMPKFSNPFTSDNSRTRRISDLRALRQRNAASPPVTGGIVGPGRVLTKAERSHNRSMRIDSTISSLDGALDTREELKKAQKAKEDYDLSFTALKVKFLRFFQDSPGAIACGRDIDNSFAPSACIDALPRIINDRRPTTLRSLVVLIILLLLVFGALYTLVEYLLLATRASACNASVTTVFVPVTYTVTAGQESAIPSTLVSPTNENPSGGPALKVITSTSTHTETSYVTVVPDPATSRLPFVS
jgi:hypothetical protein